MERWDLWMFCVAGVATCGRRGVREESRRTPQDKQSPKNCRGGGVPGNHVVGEVYTPEGMGTLFLLQKFLCCFEKHQKLACWHARAFENFDLLNF